MTGPDFHEQFFDEFTGEPEVEFYTFPVYMNPKPVAKSSSRPRGS